MKKLVLILLISCFVEFIPVNATGLGPGDAVIILKLVKQLNQLRRQYKLLDKQFNKAKQLVENTQGNYGFGNFGESSNDISNRDWSPETWETAVQDLSGGNKSRYKQLLEEYKKSHPSLPKGQYANGASASRVSSYLQSVRTNNAVGAVSSGSFNSVHKHLQDIDTLTQRIETASNSKAAIDLNSRLVAEVAYISAEQLRMQAAQSKQLAQESANNLAGQRREAMFNHLPK